MSEPQIDDLQIDARFAPNLIGLIRNMASSDSIAPDYTIRRLQPADAAGVVACVRQIYGDTYVHPELYDAEQIVRMNGSGELVSVVALKDGTRVVGHYALVRPQAGGLAETGEAMVLPEHRHHELMDRMRIELEAEATGLGLVGLFGHVVTNHVFSQKVVERFGESPCAVLLGWSPRTFHNLAEPLSQRMSTLLYFKFLGEPKPVIVCLPERHQRICEGVFKNLGVQVRRISTVQPAQGSTELATEFRADLGRGVIRVSRIGADVAEAVNRAHNELRQDGAEAVFLELPLAQPGMPAACEALESIGFSFAGIGPRFAADGDALILQWLAGEIDLRALQIDQQSARELADYVGRERDRLAQLR
jgi:hypothetical protein